MYGRNRRSHQLGGQLGGNARRDPLADAVRLQPGPRNERRDGHGGRVPVGVVGHQQKGPWIAVNERRRCADRDKRDVFDTAEDAYRESDGVLSGRKVVEEKSRKR